MTALLAVLLAFDAAFAASIVSPTDCSIAYSDSLLVSVKLSDSATVRVTVYKEQTGSEKEVTADDGSVEKETVYSDVDASNLTVNDLAAIAAGKKTDDSGKLILLSTGSGIPDYHDEVFASSVEYSNQSAGIGFYTKKLSDVKPGLYKVVVETLDNRKEVTETVVSYTAVKEKQEEKKSIFESISQSSALKFLQNLLRGLFK
jgi:hypothetical protein